MKVHRELVKWIRETYLGLAEKEPPTVALDETAVLPFTGRYVSDSYIIDISPSGDGGLIFKMSYPPPPLQSHKPINHHPPPPPPPPPLQIHTPHPTPLSP